MRKTLRALRLPARHAQRGQVLVATTFHDPQHGLVHCPAAPLLTAVLSAESRAPTGVGKTGLGKKTRVRAGAAAPPSDSSDRDGPRAAQGMMFAASYTKVDGTATGLALVAHRDDAAGMELSERTVDRWIRVLRSRRLLIADLPLCPGGRRAVRLIEETLRDRQAHVFTVGRPVIDRTTQRKLKGIGVVGSGELDQAPDDAEVIFPAHGVPLAVRAEAAARGLRVVDATCPLVAAAHHDAAAYAARGDHVVVIGHASHHAFPVLVAHAGGAAVVVQGMTDVAALDGLDPDRVSFVVDPAMPIEEVMPVVGALRRRYPNLCGHHFDVLCDHGSDRAQTIASITTASDLMLIVTGSDDTADTRSAVRAARMSGTRVRTVTRLADLDADILADATTIGMATTPTAAPGLESRIARALSGLGPLSVRRRGLRTDQDVITGNRPQLNEDAGAETDAIVT